MSDTTENLTIKKAGAEDARLLAALGTVSFYEAYFEQDSPGDLADYLHDSFSAETVAAALADPKVTYFIAYRDGKAVGYATMVDGPAAGGVGSPGAIELKRLYAVERAWGTGVGEALLRQCIDEAKANGHNSLWLGVWQENERGLRFYAKQGFRKVGTIEFPYGETVGVNDVLELEF